MILTIDELIEQLEMHKLDFGPLLYQVDGGKIIIGVDVTEIDGQWTDLDNGAEYSLEGLARRVIDSIICHDEYVLRDKNRAEIARMELKEYADKFREIAKMFDDAADGKIKYLGPAITDKLERVVPRD